ncbi:MAG TPA: acetaldehyde dehydrogenase (acetylating) [Dehalococcoidia bacterium]|nr:acetaldehyde dehydrogenase (acetylating) [Dehalococcoidia bacterium]
MAKIKCAIVGSGNIGTDLLFKLRHDPYLEVALVVGIDPASEGLAIAKRHGVETTSDGIEGFKKLGGDCEIVFEATSAAVHKANAPLYRELGKIAIDLTPAAVGPIVVPYVNIGDVLDLPNVNLGTCGAQATAPIMHAISRVTGVPYGEIVSTVASKSAGPGTRQNIDEFTVTTARTLVEVGGAEKGKAIIVLNPAEPPIMMKNTIFAAVESVDREALLASIQEAVEGVQQYVPGYRLRTDPVFDENRVTVFVEVEGAGAYLPKYAGNLDIETAAAVKVGQEFAKRLLAARANGQTGTQADGQT